jgi:hypothetical protein
LLIQTVGYSTETLDPTGITITENFDHLIAAVEHILAEDERQHLQHYRRNLKESKKETEGRSTVDYLSTMKNNVSEVGYLPKTAFTDGRLAFFAGLEGTGHHAFQGMMKECYHKGPPEHRCHYEVNLSTVQFHSYHDKTGKVEKDRQKRSQNTNTKPHYELVRNNIREGLWFGENADETGMRYIELSREMSKIAEGGVDGFHFFGLEMTQNDGHGMMSYPNFNKGLKPINYPDVFVMAMTAERYGIDFRVLVLQRTGADVMRSTARRGFSNPKVLIDNAAALLGQLKLLDPKFYHCIEYEHIANMTEAKRNRYTTFMSPDVFDFHFDNMTKKMQYSNKMTEKYPIPKDLPRQERATYQSDMMRLEKRLHSVFKNIDSLCRTANLAYS